MSEARSVVVPPARLVRWVENFATRHGGVELRVERRGSVSGLAGTAPDGSTFHAVLPFEASYEGAADPGAVAAAAVAPEAWGVLLVRKGGFAVARVAGDRIVEHKIGQRHVQGRTKAGGQSQQRFARRRDNQARVALAAAADHAARILRPGPLVTGGDRSAVEDVLEDPRLAGMSVVAPWLAVPDPRRTVLDQAIRDAQGLRVEVSNA